MIDNNVNNGHFRKRKCGDTGDIYIRYIYVIGSETMHFQDFSKCFLVFVVLLSRVYCGCLQKRLCCSGKNLSCISTENNFSQVKTPQFSSKPEELHVIKQNGKKTPVKSKIIPVELRTASEYRKFPFVFIIKVLYK